MSYGKNMGRTPINKQFNFSGKRYPKKGYGRRQYYQEGGETEEDMMMEDEDMMMEDEDMMMEDDMMDPGMDMDMDPMMGAEPMMGGGGPDAVLELVSDILEEYVECKVNYVSCKSELAAKKGEEVEIDVSATLRSVLDYKDQMLGEIASLLGAGGMMEDPMMGSEDMYEEDMM